jgi:eukaryotic-like serine/threonine-protein kinase
MNLSMRARTAVILCWLQVVIGLGILALLFCSTDVRPSLQFDYSHTTGTVTDITPGGVADRGGLRLGDRVISIGGARTGRGVNPLFFAAAHDPIEVVFDRGTTRRTTSVAATSYAEAREEALRGGGSRSLTGLSSYLVIPLNLWALALGVMLLILRPENRDARLSSLTLIYWACGNFLSGVAGMGHILAPLPTPARAAIFLCDDFFVAAFFAVCLHFALIFPSDRRNGSASRWHVLPYLAVIPMFIEGAHRSLTRLSPLPAGYSPAPTSIYDVLGPLLLIVALAVLAVRFMRATEVNARRRQQLVFIALLPAVIGFVIFVIIDRFTDAFTARAVGVLQNQFGVGIGSGIYVYAVFRHRMYNIRFLIRRSLQYALARGTLVVAMSLPAMGLAYFLWVHRNDSLAALLTGTPAVYLLVILPLVLVVRYRPRLLDALDRRYFREQYDARRLLLHVVSVIRDGSDMFGLSRVALDEIDQALHPKHISLWRITADGSAYEREFVRGDAPENPLALRNSGALPALLASSADPLDLYSRASRQLVERLPSDEGRWIRLADAYLLVPLLIEQRLVGIMLLSERRSEEPYSTEDRELLRTLATQLALTFGYSRSMESPSLVWTPGARTPAPIVDEVRSCPVCGRCYSSEQDICEVDRQPLVREEGVPHRIEEKYIITRVLGRGGMGSVFLATQKRLNRPVAVKVLLGHLAHSVSMRTRFEREARIVARLRHPAIVTIHDFGVLPSTHAYLVMEYLDGETLRKTILTGPQTLQSSLAILRPVCDAVDSAHRAGVVHRDLKPENIIIVSDHEGGTAPRVLDFGLAKMTGPIGDDEATLAQTGQTFGVVGTLFYLAPEVLSGKPADARSDQYSLGLIAYELLAGRHPFAHASDLAAIVQAHTSEVPEPLDNIAPSLPANVARAVARALSKAPHDRFPSVAELIASLSA